MTGGSLLGDRGGVQGQKSESILDQSTFRYGFNAANRVAKKWTVPEIWCVEVDTFSTFYRKNRGQKMG